MAYLVLKAELNFFSFKKIVQYLYIYYIINLNQV